MISIFTIYSDLCKLSMPVHWRIYRLKDIITSSRSGIWGDEEKRDSNDVVCYRVADFDYFNLCLKFNNITYRNILPEQVNEKLLSEGDLLLEKSGGGEKTPVGRVVFVNSSQKAVCSNFIQALSVNQEQSARFVLYLFHSIYSNRINTLFFNQTTGIQNLKISQYFAQEILLPPYSEQEAIAAYLDKECGKIGEEIGLLERKVDCYRNLRHSLIIKTVTQKSPNYHAYRLKDVFELRNGYTPSKVVNEFWEGGTIPWFRMEDIRKNGRILSDSIQHITQEAIKTAGLFEANSFILATTATIGEHAWLIADSLANQRFTNLKIRKSLKEKVSVKWMFYKFFHIDEYCKRGCRVTTFAAVDMVELTNMPIYLPPIEEQLKDVGYLDDNCNKIDTIINKIESKIELLKDLKRSLINEVVTGQRAINQ